MRRRKRTMEKPGSPDNKAFCTFLRNHTQHYVDLVSKPTNLGNRSLLQNWSLIDMFFVKKLKIISFYQLNGATFANNDGHDVMLCDIDIELQNEIISSTILTYSNCTP